MNREFGAKAGCLVCYGGGVQLDQVTDPLSVLDQWKQQAEARGVPLPEAMTLATVDQRGRPRARVVLLRGRRERQLHFFTNYESDKGRELDASGFAAVCIHYAEAAHQVRVEGDITRLPAAESDAYFASRPRDRQLGAWASNQSRPLASREALEAAYAEIDARFSGQAVPRPAHWGGYALTANMVELWLGRDGRLHDRARYDFDGSNWRFTLLQP